MQLNRSMTRGMLTGPENPRSRWKGGGWKGTENRTVKLQCLGYLQIETKGALELLSCDFWHIYRSRWDQYFINWGNRGEKNWLSLCPVKVNIWELHSLTCPSTFSITLTPSSFSVWETFTEEQSVIILHTGKRFQESNHSASKWKHPSMTLITYFVTASRDKEDKIPAHFRRRKSQGFCFCFLV